MNEQPENDIKAYLDWVLDAIKQYASQIRRTTFLALFLMAVFTVISQSGEHVSLKGFDISRGSVVGIFLPAVVACLFLQLVTDTNRAIVLYKIFSTNFSQWTNRSKLGVPYSLVMPPLPLAWGSSMARQYPRANSSLSIRVHQILVKSIDKVTPFIGVTFLIFAYIALSNSWRNDPSRLTLTSFAVSSLISLICFVFGCFAYREPSDP